MSRAHVATVIAVFVTTSIATNLLVVGTRGPLSLPARLRFRPRRLGRRIRHFIDDQVAAMIARRERQAAIGALGRIADCELLSHTIDRRPK